MKLTKEQIKEIKKLNDKKKKLAAQNEIIKKHYNGNL